MTSSAVVALVPCKDGADSIGATVRSLLGAPLVDEVLVVDDGSVDDTAGKAAAAGARVVRLEQNGGKGAALTAGVASAPEARTFLLVDADTGASAAGAAVLLTPVLAGELDLAIGVLPSAGGRGGFGTVLKVARSGIARLCGFTATAPLSGQRAITGELLRSLVFAPRFGVEVAMTVDAVRNGARVGEMPVDMDHRHRGRSIGGFIHRGKQGWDVVTALAPRRLGRFMTAGISVGLVALMAMALFLVSGQTFSTNGSEIPRTPVAKVVLVPGLKWPEKAGDVLPPNMAAASVSGGNAMTPERIEQVIRGGTKDLEAEPHGEVEVDVQTQAEVEALGLPTAGPGETVIVVGTAAGADDPSELRPLFVFGTGLAGSITSGSTHRSGLADLVDIAPTVLTATGQDVPREMDGTPLRFDSGARAEAGQLGAVAESVRFYEDIKAPVITAYVLVLTAAALAALTLVRRKRWSRRLAPVALTSASFPLATYVSKGLGGSELQGWLPWSALTAAVVGIIVFMAAVGARNHFVRLRRILGATVMVLVLDALVGTPLQNSGIFGSSPLLGTRYYGFGNPTTTVLLLAFTLWSALRLGMATNRKATGLRLAGDAFLLALVIGFPGLGADAGGFAVAILVGALLAGVALNVPVRASRALAAGVVSLVALFGVGLLDRMRNPGDRTHLGRFVDEVVTQGPGTIVDFIVERAELNLLGYGFPYTLVVVALAFGFLIGLLRGHWTGMLPLESADRFGVTAAMAVSGVLYLVNDSGVVVLALSAVFVIPFLLVRQHLAGPAVNREVAVQ